MCSAQLRTVARKHQLYMARQRQTGKAWSSAESDCGSCPACVKPARPGPPRWLHRARSSRSCSRGHRADPRLPRACDVPIACRPPCACVDAILRSQTPRFHDFGFRGPKPSVHEMRYVFSQSAVKESELSFNHHPPKSKRTRK